MIRWTFLHVPVHMITVGDFQSDWRINDGKKHRSVPEVFSRGFAVRGFGLAANTENSRRTREKPLVPRVKLKLNVE